MLLFTALIESGLKECFRTGNYIEQQNSDTDCTLKPW
jgi:hypothetical protein